jgi:hypothetical protein
MNINELTIGEAKELACLFGQSKCSSIMKSQIGKYVIVRSRNEGINAGILAEADETGCVLNEARRIWYHKPKDKKTAWYEGVAVSGLDSSSKVSCPVEAKIIVEDYSIILCTNEAKKSISGHPSHES